MDDIKPCPFCGASASVEEGVNFGKTYFSVGCDSKDENCCVGYQSFQEFSTRREAIEAWNKRAPLKVDE